MVDIKSKIRKLLGQNNNPPIDGVKLAKLYRMATLDSKTQLNNFRFFNGIFKREFSRSNRYERPISLLILDIDDFKKVNDTHGYLKGDDILQMVATLIKNNIRESDVASRFGGEEFVVLLPETSSIEAEKMAERIRECVANDALLLQYKVTVSVGLASHNDKKQEPRKVESAYSRFMPKTKEPVSESIDCYGLFEKANVALRYAKKNGKNRTILYSKLSRLDFLEKAKSKE